MDPRQTTDEQSGRQVGALQLLEMVARAAPGALAAVAIATAVVTTMSPEQAAASSPGWLFAVGTAIGANLLSDRLGDLARGRPVVFGGRSALTNAGSAHERPPARLRARSRSGELEDDYY